MAPTSNGIVTAKTRYLTAKIEGVEIFYREAGYQRCADPFAAAWVSNIVTHVSPFDSDVG